MADLTARHEPLRTVFPDADGTPCQRVLPADQMAVPFGRYETSEEELPALIARGFDLATEPPPAARRPVPDR